VSPEERDHRNDRWAAWAVVGLVALGVLVWGYALPGEVGFQELWQP
jgi:hypothetical protein